MNLERIKIIIRQADPYAKNSRVYQRGWRLHKFDFIETFRNQLFPCVRVSYHQNAITYIVPPEFQLAFYTYYVKYKNTLTCKRISWDSG